MITLKTLAQATAQQVFDQAALHLLTQNQVSENIGECLYRLGELKCAAGCFISDEEYNENMEGLIWYKLIELEVAPKNHKDLIRSLQKVHDASLPADWKENLITVAKGHKLNYDVVTNL